jgi:uncharacterized protein DUF3592
LAFAAAFVVAVNLEQQAGDELVATGVRTPGTVTQVMASSKGGWMEVRFAVGGVDRVRKINLNGLSPAYHPGDHVTVVHDPADPERLRTDVEENDPLWAVIILVVLLVPAVGLLPAGSVECFRWSRRYRDVRRNGWRRGHATIALRRNRRVLDVRFDDGVTLRLRENARRATEIPDRGEVEVWVGGAGKARAMLFRGKPFLSAARVVVK